MPKGKKKGKYEHRRTEQAYSSDEDAGIDMTIDNCSETSAQSDLKSNHDDAGAYNDDNVASDDEGDVARPVEVAPNTYTYISTDGLPLDGNYASGKKTGGETRIKRAVSLEIGSRNHRLTWKSMSKKWQPRPPRPEIIEEMYLTPEHILKIANDRRYYDTLPDETKADPVSIKQQKENEIQEKLEEKVMEIMEALSARSSAARANALVSLRAALQRRALDALLCSHRVTLAEHVARALRRGKDNERRAAAALAPLLALQIGEEGTEEYVREVRPALTATAIDKSASVETRTQCCSSLAVLCYLMEDDLTEILEVMRVYETIFSGSYLKGDGSVKVSGSALEEGGVHAAALDGWALLLALLAPTHALQLLSGAAPSYHRLAQLLEACALEVRMAAGNALAIAYEAVADDDDDDTHPLAAQVDAILPTLNELARDSHKYRAKRDRKIQRATFRDILKYFEEGSVTSMCVRVGSETVRWSTWCGGALYAALAAELGAALSALAPRHQRLRHALALTEHPPADLDHKHKPNKLQRHLANSAACKARTLVRNKNRDKRSAALAM